MFYSLHASSTYLHLDVLKCHTLCGAILQMFTLLGLVFAAPLMLTAQACVPQLFQTGAFASLTPSGASHQILLRQNDGSYTAFEIPDATPYQALSTTPNFGRQLRNCPNPEPTDIPAPISTGIYSATPSGGAIFVNGGPLSDYSAYNINVTVFDHSMNQASTKVVSIPDQAGDYSTYTPLLVADVNHDGNPDLVLAQCTQEMSLFLGCAVAVMLADGHGSFAQPASYAIPIPNDIGVIVAADINGDGHLDLVLSSAIYEMTGTTPLGIIVLLGRGDGSFEPWKAVVPGVNVTAFALADLNHDGKPDLVFSVSGGVSVALGNGDGTFASPGSYPANSVDISNIAIGDVNGDGNEDIVVEGGSILFGDGKGGFPTRRDYVLTAGRIILADFDGDGKTDIVFAGGFDRGGDSQIIYGDSLTVFFGQGGGAFAAPPFLNITNFNGSYPSVVATGDFDGDGTLDLLATQGSTIGILKGNSDGTFTAAAQYNFDAAAGVPNGVFLTALTADFNHDGKLDFAVVGSGPINSLIQVYLGNGDGTFQPPVSTPFAAEINAIIVGDLNGDGVRDLAVGAGPYQAAGDTVQILLGNGDGTFRQGAQYPTGPGVSDLVAADFNGDGKLDLAVATVGVAAFPGPAGGNPTILLGNGDGTFSAGAVLPVIANLPGKLLTAADFNKDGKIDLAVATADYTAVLLGNGDGTFGVPMTYNAEDMVSAADVNGDGTLDLVTGSGIMFGNGDGSFQPAIPVNIAGQPVSSGFLIPGDFNHDGKIDFLYGGAIALNISAPPPPQLSVVSAATLEAGPLAPDSLATAWGINLAATAEASQTLVPVLGGTTVSVKDSTGTVRAAPLLYASPHQVNFLIPAGTRIGPVTVTVMNGAAVQTANAFIAQMAPGLFVLNENALAAAYAISVSPTGQQTIENVFSVTNGSLIPSPIGLGAPGTAVYLVLLGTGMGSATTAEVIGLAANPLVGDVGPTPGIDGLEQIKVLLPTNPSGRTLISVAAQGAVSNTVVVYFK